MDPKARSNVELSYDRVADEYVRRIFDELQHKPLDRQLLDRLAERVRGQGPICDMGCGPGHVARYLHEGGAAVVGVDLSPKMVERAQRLNPDISFSQGDMLALKVADETWAGIVAFYSIIHLPRTAVVQALMELKRVLKPGGVLLLAFHIGDQTIHLDEWWGHQVCVDFFYFQPPEMCQYLEAAGFEVEEIFERGPHPNAEHPSRRAYLFASKPASLQQPERGT